MTNGELEGAEGSRLNLRLRIFKNATLKYRVLLKINYKSLILLWYIKKIKM